MFVPSFSYDVEIITFFVIPFAIASGDGLDVFYPIPRPVPNVLQLTIFSLAPSLISILLLA